MVVPIVLYGSEIWAHHDNLIEMVERLQLKFCKYLLKAKPSTPTCMVRGECGIYPLRNKIRYNIMAFWTRILCGKQSKLIYQMYCALHQLHSDKMYTSPWIANVKRVLEMCGFPIIWIRQSEIDRAVKAKILYLIQSSLDDQFIQEFHFSIQNSPSCILYKFIKTDFGLEPYLNSLSDVYRTTLCKLRLSNNKLEVTKGRYNGTPRINRLCRSCNSSKIGDEYHLIFECDKFQTLRDKYILNYFTKRPNMYKVCNLINMKQNATNNFKFVKFIHECFRLL